MAPMDPEAVADDGTRGTAGALKGAAELIGKALDRAMAMQSRLEDLLFRAQRLANAIKLNLATRDSAFGFDLRRFRSEVRSLANDLAGLPGHLSGLKLAAPVPEGTEQAARTVSNLAGRLLKAVQTLHDQSHVAHEQIRQAEFKVEAWAMVQEISEMSNRCSTLKTAAHRLMIKTSSPEGEA